MKTLLAAFLLALACAALARGQDSAALTRAPSLQEKSDGGYDDEEDRA